MNMTAWLDNPWLAVSSRVGTSYRPAPGGIIIHDNDNNVQYSFYSQNKKVLLELPVPFRRID